MRPPAPSSWRSLALLAGCLGPLSHLPRLASGAASGPLLGGQYVPSTDVEYLEDLTGLLEGIAAENDHDSGTALYKQPTPDGISLESLTYATDANGSPTTEGMYLDARTNPLYSIYMYALWRSNSGSGKDDNDELRKDMQFVSKPVDYYPHSIITDMFSKASAYDPELTADTIRAANVWMATAQALYEAVEMCDAREVDIDDATFVNPVDMAAAFWLGSLDDASDATGETMHAWARRMRDNFSATTIDANFEIVAGLNDMKSLFDECFVPGLQEETAEEKSFQMRMRADDITRTMTVPLVQNLIHHAALVVSDDSPSDANTVDYQILYGLLALEPIIVCDETAFNDLYSKFVSPGGKNLTSDALYDALVALYSRLVCLGITCEWIGESNVLTNNPGNGWPGCQDPATDFQGYPGTDPDQLVEFLKVDLDVRTMGTLVEMDAQQAAYDVYFWGRHSKDSQGKYVSFQSLALETYHEKNEVGKAFNSYFSDQISNGGTGTFADRHEYQAMMGLGVFAGATLTQRRIVMEATMVLVTLHAYALDGMYTAIDFCRGLAEDLDDLYWDRAFAAISGWAEETEDASGFLFMEIPRYLCRVNDGGNNGCAAGTADDSEINQRLLAAMTSGKESLSTGDCDAAEAKVKEVEKLLQTTLVDAVAYFAEKIADGPVLKDNLAEGYGVAVALVPIMQNVDSVAADIVERNMGVFGANASPFQDGLAVVHGALATFVDLAGIDCTLLTSKDVICSADGSESGPTGLGTSVSSPTRKPVAAPSVEDDGDDAGETSGDEGYCGAGIGGGLPSSLLPSSVTGGTIPSAPLLGGAYTPTSNVDHIIALTDNVELLEAEDSKTTGLELYTQVSDGVSLQCLSTESRWVHITQTNPLYVIYMYGLWISDDGDNDSDGYSNKVFDDGDISRYGDTIVMDEMNKSSGFDAKLTAETVRVTNMWMSVSTELYRAAESCRDGYVDKAPQGFNPVDHAAALWFGSQDDPDSSVGGSLYSWAKRAQDSFFDASMGVNDVLINNLGELQKGFNDCRGLSKDQQEKKGIELKHLVDNTTKWMTVPIVQNFISHLASESGMVVPNPDERNYMVLYALIVLPYLSICDEDTFDDMFSDLITDIDAYDSSTFKDHIESLQDRYECLGLTCGMVGKSTYSTADWPECKVPSAASTNIAGYTPTTEDFLEMLKMDIDISTILTFIVMEANDAALDLYENGRNAKDIATNSYVSLKSISTPESHPDAIAIYENFSEAGYLRTSDAIEGTEAFLWSSPLKNSAAASLSIATADMHLVILDNLYQAVECGSDGQPAPGWDAHWDKAAAATIGWTEGFEDKDDGIDSYLFFQVAEELCERFDSCDDGGKSILNQKIMTEFTSGQEKLKNNQCEEAKASQESIERYLQAILVDSLAYHAKFADSGDDERHCLMAYVASNALIPLIRPVNLAMADVIEANIVATSLECRVDDVEKVYEALNAFVTDGGIDCAWLGSSVCDATSTTINFENDSDYTPNPEEDPTTAEDERTFLYDGEYEPMANVEKLLDMSSVVLAICNAGDTGTAKDIYLTDESAGVSIKSMSTSAKYAMTDELQFNQFVYALQDNVDKTDGSLLFDGKPATEYANTISNDAIDTSTTLGCRAVKVLNLWMWIVHKMNDSVIACRDNDDPTNYGPIDDAAALWVGSLLYEMAEELGPKFGHTKNEGMTTLNKLIVDRFKRARDIIFTANNECSADQLRDLRIVVKETVSYMTAVLIQSLIDAMLDDTDAKVKEETVELMAFATLPHIKTCGHESTYDDMYKSLVSDGFDQTMIGDTLTVLQDHYNCLGLSCADVGRHTKASEAAYPQCSDDLDIAGYTPVNSTKANMINKLDLDAVAIQQMLSMEKNEIAKSIYMQGHNYFDYDKPKEFGFVSLHNMTQRHTIDFTDFDTWRLYDDYLGSGFANDLIIDVMDRTGRFKETTGTQRALAVNVAISSMISYMSALEALYFSVSRCDSDISVAETAFDGAVALLVGSVEGQNRGGSLYSEGKMFYGIGKRTCQHFHSCRVGDAEVNVELYRTLTKLGLALGVTELGLGLGQNFTKQDCADAAKTVESIDALLKVPLIQSLLYFADAEISAQSDDDAAGYVASMAVLPILNDIDPTSAESIKSAMDFTTTPQTTSENKESTVTNAVTAIFSDPKTSGIVDCNLVTKVSAICNNGQTVAVVEDDEPIDADAPMPISNGLYVATNYVGDRSAIALDIQEIEERLQASDWEEARHIYTHGRNSKVYDENGLPTGELRSISGFSMDSQSTMKGDPTYNLFVYGLSDQRHEYSGRPTTRYADSFVQDLLYSESLQSTDAMVAVTIWMQVAHSLHSAYGACKQSYLADGRTIGSRALWQNSDPALMIDEAAAYWIGDNQDTGSSGKGHLLYALTETIGVHFETVAVGSESTINGKIIDLFNKAKGHIAISRGCTTSEDSHLKLKAVIDELIPLMAVPLLRSLLYYLSEDEPAMVKVYAVAVLPLFSACAPSTYRELKDVLIDNDLIEIQKGYIYAKIQSLYGCLGLTCDLVGSLANDEVLQCDDGSEGNSLAGYRYVADDEAVNTASRVDVDIKKIGIFIDNGISHFPDSQEVLFGTAFDLYRYGTRSTDSRGSLSSMAKDTNRDIVPTFATFERYFSNENYADTMIGDAFQKNGVFAQATAEQRKRVILFLLKYNVTYMSILEKLYSALRSCRDDKRTEGATNLDIAVAYFVGSLEGTADGGSFDGDLIYMLAKRMCIHYGTCTTDNDAMINERIINLFYAGQGEVETGACNSLERTVKEIENDLIVPLIQGALFSVRTNELYFHNLAKTEFYSEGYALAQSILPLISIADESSGNDIENVMVAFFPGQSDKELRANDSIKVALAVQSALMKMDVDCSKIGRLDGRGFCPGDEVSFASPASSRASVSIVSVAIAGLLWVVSSAV